MADRIDTAPFVSVCSVNRILAIALAGALLQGCGSLSSDFSLSGSETKVVEKLPGQLEKPRSIVVVAGLTGPSPGALDRILGHLDRAATGSNLALVNNAASTGPYRIQGHLLISPAAKKSPAALSYVWTVMNADGSKRGQVTGSETLAGAAASSDPWSAVTDPMLKTMAEKVMLAVIDADAPMAQTPAGYVSSLAPAAPATASLR